MIGSYGRKLWEVIMAVVLVSVRFLKIKCSLTLGNATRS